MALHRDIYWVGRQWAVTGYGIQACNQKQKGQFDIEGSRLWEAGVLESLRAEPWLNSDDFERALEVARKHYPEPLQTAAKPEPNVPELKPAELKQAELKAAPSTENPVEAPMMPAQKFELRIESWPAKFVRPWRVRVRH
jgi:hypothetical protein